MSVYNNLPDSKPVWHGTWVSLGKTHYCRTPSDRAVRKAGAGVGAIWRCHCGQAWKRYETWAGDGWTEVDS